MSLICQSCEHEAIPHNRDEGIVGDTFARISWELVDSVEFEERRKDGRSTSLMVCPTCYEEFTGEESKPIGVVLAELNNKRTVEDGLAE